MTDNNDDKTLHVTGKKTLTLKPSGLTQGTVRQDMGRGRAKTVVVETRKRRPGGHDDKPQLVVPVQARPAPTVAQQPQRTHVEQRRPEPQRPGGGAVLNQLSAGEIDARRRALAEAAIRDAEDAKVRAEENARRAKAQAEEAARQAEEAARRKAEDAERGVVTEEPVVEAKVAEPAVAAAAERRAEPVAELVRRPAEQAPVARRPDAPGATPVNARPGAVPPGRGRREQEEEEARARRGAPVRGKVGARVEVAKPVR